MIQGDIITSIKSVSFVASIAGVNVFWLVGPDGMASSSGHVVVRQISESREMAHDGDTGLVTIRIQVDCYAKRNEDAAKMRNAITTAFNGFRGTMGGSTIEVIEHANSVDFYSENVRLFQATADFLITYQD